MAHLMATYRVPAAGALTAVLASCSSPHPTPTPPSATAYALGVATGQCPPDVAFYHAARGGTSTELGVIAAAVQTLTYVIDSGVPAYDGRTGSATVTTGSNGHTFTVDIPFAAITAVHVRASGNRDVEPSACTAVPL
jgi:hypothetical protein